MNETNCYQVFGDESSYRGVVVPEFRSGRRLEVQGATARSRRATAWLCWDSGPVTASVSGLCMEPLYSVWSGGKCWVIIIMCTCLPAHHCSIVCYNV